jgi:glycosyltransferase involved in cell wall biosynthesis
MSVIVVDDSREPVGLEGVETIVMPYDSGVSAGRSEALKHVETPYLMLLDDDFIFHRHTNILHVLKKLECLLEVDIIGGDVIYLPFYRKIDYAQEGLHPTKALSLAKLGTQIGGMKVHDKVANFYIARTQSIRKVGWDPQIKRLDHADFFTRAKGVLTTVFDPDFKVLHARTPFDKVYMGKRLDIEEDRKILRNKYYKKIQ